MPLRVRDAAQRQRRAVVRADARPGAAIRTNRAPRPGRRRPGASCASSVLAPVCLRGAKARVSAASVAPSVRSTTAGRAASSSGASQRGRPGAPSARARRGAPRPSPRAARSTPAPAVRSAAVRDPYHAAAAARVDDEDGASSSSGSGSFAPAGPCRVRGSTAEDAARGGFGDASALDLRRARGFAAGFGLLSELLASGARWRRLFSCSCSWAAGGGTSLVETIV